MLTVVCFAIYIITSCSASGFDTTSGCQFCSTAGGRGDCGDSSTWDIFGAEIVSYCTLSCSFAETTYTAGSCDCNSFVCNTQAATTTSVPSSEDCVVNCTETGRYCTSEAEYTSMCAVACYGLTANDLITCPATTTSVAVNTTECVCEGGGEAVCCADEGDHAGNYPNACSADCAGCVNSYSGVCTSTTTNAATTTTKEAAATTTKDATTTTSTICDCDNVISYICCEDEGKFGVRYNNSCYAECMGCNNRGQCTSDTMTTTATTTDAGCFCDANYAPVCCIRDANDQEVKVTYSNACNADCNQCQDKIDGECGTTSTTEESGAVKTTSGECGCESVENAKEVCCTDNGVIYGCSEESECNDCYQWTLDFDTNCTAIPNKAILVDVYLSISMIVIGLVVII